MPFSHCNSFTCRLSHRPGALDVEYNLRPVIRNPQNGALYLLYPTEFGPLKKQGCQILAPMVSLCFIPLQSILEKLNRLRILSVQTINVTSQACIWSLPLFRAYFTLQINTLLFREMRTMSIVSQQLMVLC